MVKIKFKEGTHFNKIRLIKYVHDKRGISPSEAKKVVESGVIECPNYEQYNVIKKIEECGGIFIGEIEPLPHDNTNVQSKKENVAAIRIVPSKCEEGLAIESEIPVEKYVFQTLNDYPSMLQFVTNQMPFICGFTQQRIQLQNGEEEYCSLLGARILTNRNTLDEITSLSKVVRDVHTEIISTIYRFRNLVRKFKPFIDDVEVETRSDNNN